MRKLLLLVGALLVAHAAFLFVRPSGATEPPVGEGLDVGIVFDVGGRGDKSFNDGAYAGAMRAARDLGARVRFIEPGEGSDREAGLRLLAAQGLDLVVGVGFIFTDDLASLAAEYPNVRFAGVDFAIANDPAGNPILPPRNLAALKFREEEGSFLVGALAALVSAEPRIGPRPTTPTRRVGFVGGMDIPLIHKFEAGFTAGAKAANKNVRVIAQYVGTTPEAWNNPAKAKEIASSMKARGADVIYAAAGASGGGVIDYVKQTQCLKAAQLPKGVTFKSDNFKSVAKSAGYTKACAGNARPMFFIGVDANQNYLGDFDKNPKTLNHGLTSMLKRVDVAVYETVKQVSQGKFQPGAREFGLQENGVGFALDQYNSALIGKAQQDRVAKVRADIIAGKIKVPSAR